MIRKKKPNRCDKEALEESLFGYCLLRILNHIHTLKIYYPTKQIIMSKTDLDAAYRQRHVMIRFALICMKVIDRIAYIFTRLPFRINSRSRLILHGE